MQVPIEEDTNQKRSEIDWAASVLERAFKERALYVSFCLIAGEVDEYCYFLIEAEESGTGP
jgi:hypothetical protein